jgi:hypothetical protein
MRSDALHTDFLTSEPIIMKHGLHIVPRQTVTLMRRLLLSYHQCYTHCNTTAKEYQIPISENERLSAM